MAHSFRDRIVRLAVSKLDSLRRDPEFNAQAFDRVFNLPFFVKAKWMRAILDGRPGLLDLTLDAASSRLVEDAVERHVRTLR